MSHGLGGPEVEADRRSREVEPDPGEGADMTEEGKFAALERIEARMRQHSQVLGVWGGVLVIGLLVWWAQGQTSRAEERMPCAQFAATAAEFMGDLETGSIRTEASASGECEVV